MLEELRAQIEKDKEKNLNKKGGFVNTAGGFLGIDRLFNAAKETFNAFKTELIPQSVQATKDIAQGTARGVVGTLASIGNLVLNQEETRYKPTTKVEEKIFGTKDPFGYKSEYQDIGEAGAGFLGVENETLKKVVGAPIGLGLFALDVLPGGKGTRKVIQESIEEGRSIVRAAAPQLEKTFADDILMKTKGITDVEKVRSIVKEEALKYTTPQTFDEVAKARKYIDEFVDIQEKARKGEGELPSTLSKGLKDVKKKFVDFAAPIEDTLWKAQKNFKFSLLPSDDITNQIDTVLRAPVVATQFIKNNGLDDVIKSFPSEKELVNFDQYLLSKHSVDLNTKGIETGRDLAKDQAIIRAFSGQFEEKAQKVITYAQKLLDYVTERGLISKELNTQLKKQYPNYVPFARIFSEIEQETMPALFSKKGIASLGSQSVVQKISGSTRAVENPIESLLAKTYDAVYQAEKNKAAAMIASYKDLPGNPFQLKKVKSVGDVSKGMDYITTFENGVKKIYETTPEIAAAAKALNVQQLGLLEKIFAFPVRVAKLGITGINIPFVLSNIAKDQLTAFINASGGVKKSLANPMVTVKALFAALNHNKLYDEAADALAVGTSFDIARNQMKRTVAEIRSNKDVVSKIKYLATNPKELLRSFENIVGKSEEFTRIQQFEATRSSLAKSLSDTEARVAAGRAARENTANFYRRGEYGTAMNAALLYMNASIQGARSFIRAFKKSPKNAATKLAVSVFFPMLAITAYNLKDEKRKGVYDDIEEFEKQNNFIIIPPNPTKDASGRWNVIKIPLPPHLANLSSIPRRMLEGSVKIDAAGAGYIFEKLLGSVSPIEMDIQKALGQLTPQILKPSIESITNTNMFTGLPIVPQSMKDLSPELQYKDYTSGTVRLAGKALDVSPIKAEQWIKSTFGGVGSQALNAVDTVLAGVNLIPEDQIGGKSVLEAISDRFTSALGGATERKVIESISSELQSVADERFRITEEAEILHTQLSQMDKAEANAKVSEIKKTNKKVYEELKDLVAKEKLGLDYSDRLLIRLPVEDGTRAKYIYTLLKSMESDEERSEYVKEMRKKKVISDKVFAQIKKLKASKQ
jgi:hypothetical protein